MSAPCPAAAPTEGGRRPRREIIIPTVRSDTEQNEIRPAACPFHFRENLLRRYLSVDIEHRIPYPPPLIVPGQNQIAAQPRNPQLLYLLHRL